VHFFERGGAAVDMSRAKNQSAKLMCTRGVIFSHVEPGTRGIVEICVSSVHFGAAGAGALREPAKEPTARIWADGRHRHRSPRRQPGKWPSTQHHQGRRPPSAHASSVPTARLLAVGT
jgi:hypothetical protein